MAETTGARPKPEGNPVDRPFNVRIDNRTQKANKITEPSTFLSGHDEITQAEARAKQANKDATDLGVKARYVVTDRQGKVL